MKRLILITIGVLLVGSLFAQSEKTKLYVQQLVSVGIENPPQVHTAAEVTLTADDCKNVIHINGDADVIKFILPPCALGLVVAFWDQGGAVVTVDPFDEVDKIWIEAQDGGAGNEMESDGTIGRYIILVARDNTSWWALPIEALTWGIP